MNSGHQEKAMGDQIKSFRDCDVTYAICIMSKQWKRLIVFDSFAKVHKTVQHYRLDVIAGDANAAANKYYKRQEYQDLYNFSVAVTLRDMQREVDIDRPLESRLHFD